MLLKQLSAISLLIVFSLQPALPAKACLENCHSGSESCHRAVLSQTESPKCPHTKPVSVAEAVTKAGCECTLQDTPSTARDIQFTLDTLRSEWHKFSGIGTELLPGIAPVLSKAGFHGPPSSLTPDRQYTFLINSRLRI